MGFARFFRTLTVGVLVAATVAVAAPTASAASIKYVVVHRDGRVEVASMTPEQAARRAADDDVRVVSPQQTYQVDNAQTAIVTSLDVPGGLKPGDTVPGRYIVTLTSTVASGVAAANVSMGVRAFFSNAVRGFVADLSQADINELRTNPNVRSIEPDRVLSIEDTQTNPPSWGLDRIDQRALPTNNSYTYSHTGAGVIAYVVDSGINSAHTNFTRRILNGFTAVNDGQGTEDCHGHGTHVSGIIGGTTYGVAKGISIAPVRIFDCLGRGTVSGALAAIDWIIADHATGSPAVANLSLGGAFGADLNAAVANGVADGVTFVVAAGNDNGDACVKSPASEPSAITVGATQADDQRASYSNWGSCVDLFAPGTLIKSAYKGTATASAYMSGTSMAAPHVAGVVALYLQNNTSASPASVASAILGAATRNVVSDAGADSPNRLLYSASFTPAPAAVPAPPTGLTVVSAGDRSVTLSWTAPSDNGGSTITDYVVEYLSASSAVWATYSEGVGTGTTTTLTGLTNDTTYTFRVRAVNAVGTGTASGLATGTPVAPGAPSAPRSLTVAAGYSTLTLSWIAPLSDGGAPITDYIVETSTSTSTPASWTTYDDGISTSLSATLTLSEGVKYSVRVRAKNNVGSGEASNVVDATPLAYNPPSAPRNVTASAQLNAAYVTWAAPLNDGGAGVTGYIVDWSTDGNTWQGNVRLSNAIFATTVTGMSGGVATTVRVRATNAYGTSPSATVSVTPIAPTAPGAMTAPTVTVGYNTATVSWITATGTGGSAIIGYYVEWSSDAGVAWTRSALQDSTSRSLTFTGLVGGTSHLFRVRAVNAVGTGTPSSSVSAIPIKITGPTAPMALSGLLSGTSAILSWGIPLGNGGAIITGYVVEQSTDNGASWTTVLSIASAATRSGTVTGLATGVSHEYRVRAVNSVGAGNASNVVSLEPKSAGTPNPPSTITATVNFTTVNVTWNAVTSINASVTDYLVEYSTDGGTTWRNYDDGISTKTSASIAGMAADLAVSVRVRAVNSYGTSPPSASVTVIPRAVSTVPDAPTAVAALAGDTRAAVRWTAPVNNGGATITSYRVVSEPEAIECVTATLACVVTGLTNGVTYTFTVRATNAVGAGPSSVASNSVTPVDSAIPAVSANSWGLDRVDQRSLPLDGQLSRQGTGRGVKVYVIDTGVYADHSEFLADNSTTRVVAGHTEISDGWGTDDCNGHGTHVAGTIAGKTYGLATEATIVPVRVLDCDGRGTNIEVIAGIEWMITDHVAGTPAVANLSLGGAYDAATNDAVARAVADGITVVVAAGNDATDACTESPASSPSAITVGAITSADTKASFSNVGGCVDIFAPGTSIISAGNSGVGAFTIMSGTSMASPHVAGVVAEMLSNSRSSTPTQIADRLESDATLGAVSGLTSGTVNALLYQRPATAASSLTWDGADSGVLARDPGGTTDSMSVDFGPDVPLIQTGTEAVAFRIVKVTRSGARARVVVSAPKGYVVTLYRNGKKVARGAKKVFYVSAPRGKTLGRFRAVISVRGSLVVSKTWVSRIR